MEAINKDVYSRITSQIIEAIEAGASSYRMPWHITDADAFAPINVVSKKPYRGVNVISLWLRAAVKGYSSGHWATYDQWRNLGAQVRRGERSTLIVFWSVLEKNEKPKASRRKGEQEPLEKIVGRVLVAKGYPVFNVAQVDGYTPPPKPSLPESERKETAEKFFTALGADIRHEGFEAFYDPQWDFIQLPRFEAFRESYGYYSTLAHEVTHWTGAKSRLNREIQNRFGAEAYAAEELIAELGAAFLCSHLKMANKPRADHAAYMSSWLELFRRDKRAIFTAASKAQEAVDWMVARQGAGSAEADLELSAAVAS